MVRHVKGALFLDYARMLRARKGFDWRPYLAPEDLGFLEQRLDIAAWYPMATFERFGLAILKMIAADDLEAVRVWGQLTADSVAIEHRDVVVPGDPRESLMRFHVLRRSLFDFEAVTPVKLQDDLAHLRIAYEMSPAAEEAASYQTMGFFEGLIARAGGDAVVARFGERSWGGDPGTTLVVRWTVPARERLRSRA